MSRLARATLTVIAVVAMAIPAAAQQPPPPEGGEPNVSRGIDHFAGQLGVGSGGGHGGSGNGNGAGTATQVVNTAPNFDVGLGRTDDGTPCWRVEIGGNQTLGEAREVVNRFDRNGTLYDACPAGQRGPTLAERVAAAFESWRPAAVSADMDPGYALTGLKGYLVINDDTPSSISLVGQTVALRTEYRVSWGDGATTTTTSKGVAYPGGEGEITHVYSDAGNVTVEIDLVVSGSWNGQDLGALAPVTSTLPLEIWQVQAVRRR